MDLLNIVLTRVSNVLPKHDEDYELNRLLGALFSDKLSVEERFSILENEYSIPVSDNLDKELNSMSNLAERIEEHGIEIGKEKGIKIGKEKGIKIGKEKGIKIGKEKGEAEIILNMHKNGFTAEQIAAATSMDLEKIKAIIEKGGPAEDKSYH